MKTLDKLLLAGGIFAGALAIIIIAVLVIHRVDEKRMEIMSPLSTSSAVCENR